MFSKKNKAHHFSSKPLLTVVVDTEEEFNWAEDFNRQNRSVRNIRYQHLSQNILKKYGIVPTYCIDYPVVENDEAIGILKDWADKGECIVGAHLHPWVSPPYVEDVNRYNSYAGNLPYDVEKAKIAALTDLIEKKTGKRPTVFKAGRYGAGPNTAHILKDLGYKVDVSVVADTNFTHDLGPNFIGLPTQPYWFDVEGEKILELPNSRGYDGLLAQWGGFLYPKIAGATGVRALIAGLLAKTRLLERIPLTPEGMDITDLIRMVRKMIHFGQYHFNYSYHSSSLLIGAIPYVNNEQELETLLMGMDQFYNFFINEMGGTHKTPMEMHDILT